MSATADRSDASRGSGGAKRAAAIFVGFIHDFCAGLWAACTFAIWWIERSLASAGSAAVETLTSLQLSFFYVALACVAVVLIAGVGRTFTYVDKAYGEQAEATRRRMLLTKHAVLITVFALGTVWQYVMVFR